VFVVAVVQFVIDSARKLWIHPRTSWFRNTLVINYKLSETNIFPIEIRNVYSYQLRMSFETVNNTFITAAYRFNSVFNKFKKRI